MHKIFTELLSLSRCDTMYNACKLPVQTNGAQTQYGTGTEENVQ